MSAGGEYNPKLLGIICNWCCYGGADLCGVSRLQYPPHIRLIRVMCSARVDLAHIFRAFSHGLDGVFIGGCHLNDCHYITNGNFNALGMVKICKKLLERTGINPARLRLEWVSAGEGIRFANIMNDFAPAIRKLGPLGSSEGMDEKTLLFKLQTASKLIPFIKLVERERLRAPLKLRACSEPEKEYNKFFNSEEMNKLFDDTIADKLVINQITSLLRDGPLATGEISEALSLGPSEVSRQLKVSSRHGFVRYDAGLNRFMAV
ncbi:MAG: hydrogenase iron-sulfur subunit [Syntrophobacteraceae bacterium]|nr:hydrogenase iron-sulfur subunit [Syntrophobacteraceae bacterium]